MTGRSFADLYGATPFDANDPDDAMADAARKFMVMSYIAQMDSLPRHESHDQIANILGGLFLGLVQIAMVQLEQTDQAHAAMRAHLLKLIPWAVDLTRAMDDLPPLASDTGNAP